MPHEMIYPLRYVPLQQHNCFLIDSSISSHQAVDCREYRASKEHLESAHAMHVSLRMLKVDLYKRGGCIRTLRTPPAYGPGVGGIGRGCEGEREGGKVYI